MWREKKLNVTYYNRLPEVFIHSCIAEAGQIDPIKTLLIPRKKTADVNIIRAHTTTHIISIGYS